jgi:hypothetical protein
VSGSLLKTVESTNPAESMIEIVRHHSRRVKRWQHGEMALRWTAAGMLAAETQFRRVKGFRQLPALLAALEGDRRPTRHRQLRPPCRRLTLRCTNTRRSPTQVQRRPGHPLSSPSHRG